MLLLFGENAIAQSPANSETSETIETSETSETPKTPKTPVNISTATKLQTIQGWGVSLCWWAAQVGQWQEEQQDEIIDWIVSPEGLNYNVFRYNIPGGDDPDHTNCAARHMEHGKGLRADMAGFIKHRPANDKDHTTWTYDWDADKPQITILKKIVARCKHYGKEPIIEAFSNSAPWWMTVSGCVAGSRNGTDTNLKSEYYAAFADYIIDVCKHLESQGITIHSIDPFNEPTTDYWKIQGSQEGCGFKAKDQIQFINNHFASAVRKSGLSAVISASDETSPGLSLLTFDAYVKNATAIANIGQWNTHTYSSSRHTTNAIRESLRDAVAAKGKTLWMSETGEGGFAINGNLALAKKMFDDLRYLQPVVWCDWQAMETNDQWCFITCSGNNNRYTPPYNRNKNYYVRQHVTKYIPSGYHLVSTDNDNVLAAVSPDNSELVVCIINQDRQEANYDLSSITRNWKHEATIKTAVFTDRRNNASPDVPFTTLSNITCHPRSITTIVIT